MTTKAYSYIVDDDLLDDCGGYAQVYHIKNRKTLIFKEFKYKNEAILAYNYQKRLAKYNLAPKVKSNLFRLQFKTLGFKYKTQWGFLSEKADPVDIISLDKYDLQRLVEDIYDNTDLEFWDCHAGNVGYIRRNNKKVLVCIDTGWESFDEQSNQWGNRLPGPVCPDCKICLCNCYDKE